MICVCVTVLLIHHPRQSITTCVWVFVLHAVGSGCLTNCVGVCVFIQSVLPGRLAMAVSSCVNVWTTPPVTMWPERATAARDTKESAVTRVRLISLFVFSSGVGKNKPMKKKHRFILNERTWYVLELSPLITTYTNKHSPLATTKQHINNHKYP